ncbi:MAG TPA: hypothetical protein VHD32_08530 [Candidatus Didemnitutus sp.]|nr:hypothetical protein [Candidatus Didemnitutus sp.]
MPDDADPPRKTYGFKPREFKRDNAPVSEVGRMPTAAELAKVASEGKIVAPPAPRGAKPDDPNDVYATLQLNRSAEQVHEEPVADPGKKREHRRKRDYWIVLLSSEAVLGTIGFLGRHNVVVLMFAFGGMIFVAGAVTWIMWQVMGRY